jgi:hypothetical protein
MVRAASKGHLRRTNLVVSIRLEELLVRTAQPNPVPWNRAWKDGRAAGRETLSAGKRTWMHTPHPPQTVRDAKGALCSK